jgi:hypothetical protein
MPADLDVATLKHISLSTFTKSGNQETPVSIMPMVVPGINSSMGDKSEWVNKLMGKKISESGSDELVC